MTPGGSKGGPMRKRPKKHRKYDFEDPLHFDTFSLKNEKKSKSAGFFGDLELTNIFSRNFFKTEDPRTLKM